MSKSIQDRLKKLEYLYRCLCSNPSGQGPQGPQGIQGEQGPIGPQGIPGTGGESCPDHFKLAAMSGQFSSDSPNSPNLKDMFVGSVEYGWSYGKYDQSVGIDGFGNLVSLKLSETFNGIPLSIDLNQGDTIKISGVAYLIALTGGEPINPKFYVTVSHFNCSEIDRTIPLYTVIPVSSYSIPSVGPAKVCFSESITLGSVLASNETFFVVGFGVGNDNILEPNTITINFSYSLHVTQACIGAGSNLFIRNCCDPAYSEIIIDNGTPVGGSFVDRDGNCWSVEAITLDPINSSRTLSNSYEDCTLCIASNPCPQNFKIQSCCGDLPQTFSAALIGVNVGDTFVDTNGFCWSAIDVSEGPITNVVDVDTVYPETTCESAECVTANDCPTVVNIRSCCDSLAGSTTLEILQAALPSLVMGSTFVDTFGMCWSIRDSGYAFPDLSFIVPVTEYTDGESTSACEECVIANECPRNYYYAVQNCCTEEVEIVTLDAVYNIGEVLTLELTTGFGCYEVLSWSDTGTTTVTLVNITGVYENCSVCTEQINETLGSYCPGQVLSCTSYFNNSFTNESGVITGYKCDGTWVSDLVLLPGESVCMAQVLLRSEFVIKGDCCSFDILNPSLTESMVLFYENCQGDSGEVTVPPNTLLSTVLVGLGNTDPCAIYVQRLSEGDNDFVYTPCGN